MSGALLNIADTDWRVPFSSFIKSSTAGPVMASMRLMPAAIDDSDTIFIIPILPVFATWVPPHSSIESP